MDATKWKWEVKEGVKDGNEENEGKNKNASMIQI
jgi:hypothetical protein